MTDVSHPVRALVKDFFELFPTEAATILDSVPPAEIAELAVGQPPGRVAPVFSRLRPDVLAEILAQMSDLLFKRIVPFLEASRAAPAMARLGTDAQRRLLSLMDARTAREYETLMAFPTDSAGSMMDPGVTVLRPHNTAREALARLRKLRHKQVHDLYVVDEDGHLKGRVRLLDVAVANPTDRLDDLMKPEPARIPATGPQTEVVELLEKDALSSLPVVDFEGRLIGVIRHRELVAAAAEEMSADIQTMVGVSRDERALSPVSFAVKRRLPWLQVNLLTAFLAAAVVGLFESTIAQFTALAVLLPVVAGQSGNTGAQALAVTMRGLALREIRLRHWLRVGGKELSVGFFNGVAVALVTGLAVFVWSDSSGLATVISTAMVLSMTIAGLAGATIPMVLTTLGQDPAQAASIVLTTVTDVVGFLSFLGLATLASGVL
jgi:magnesium transporter